MILFFELDTETLKYLFLLTEEPFLAKVMIAPELKVSTESIILENSLDNHSFLKDLNIFSDGFSPVTIPIKSLK